MLFQAFSNAGIKIMAFFLLCAVFNLGIYALYRLLNYLFGNNQTNDKR